MKWSLRRSAAYGAIIGALYLDARLLLTTSGSVQGAGSIAYLVGGCVGGAVLFVIAAAIRNLFGP